MTSRDANRLPSDPEPAVARHRSLLLRLGLASRESCLQGGNSHVRHESVGGAAAVGAQNRQVGELGLGRSRRREAGKLVAVEYRCADIPVSTHESRCLERETRLELATCSLEGCRSTN